MTLMDEQSAGLFEVEPSAVWPMPEKVAAWIREHAWNGVIRAEYKRAPDELLLCGCQLGASRWCKDGQHSGCHRECPHPSAEAWIKTRRGTTAQFPEQYKHPFPWKGGHQPQQPDAWARLWLVDRVCRWVCSCSCNDEGQAVPECRFNVGYRHVGEDEPTPPTVAKPGYHLRYWFRCDCGELGPLRSSENSAAEDGADHAYPGWRDMPVMGERPHEGRELARWEKDARAAYPKGWFERGGPVREYRSPGGTRHVPGYAPGGGHCMAVLRTRKTTPPQPAPTAKDCTPDALF